MSENWQLYAQQGVNGTEYGIRIRPGYIVVGFQKEDAEEIIRLHDEVERLRSENEALNEKLIEAKAKEIYPFNMPHWDNLPEEDTVDKLCPIVTRRGKAYWRKEATRQLAEEMPEVDWQ